MELLLSRYELNRDRGMTKTKAWYEAIDHMAAQGEIDQLTIKLLAEASLQMERHASK